VAGQQPRLVVDAAGPGRRVESARLGAELGGDDDPAAEGPLDEREAPVQVAGQGAQRLAGALVPAFVEGHADRVHVAIHEPVAVGRQRAAPHVERHRTPGIDPMQQARAGVDPCRLPAGVAVVGDLVAERPREDRRVDGGQAGAEHDAPARTGAQRRRVRRPVSGRVDRPDLLPDEDPGRVEALEQRGVEQVLGARGVGVDRLQALHDRVHVGRQQRVAAVLGVLLQGCAPQAQRHAVEPQAPAAPAQLAQPDALGPAGFGRDLEVQLGQRGVAGRPEVGVGDAQARRDVALLAGRKADGREGQALAAERALHAHGARLLRAVAHRDGDVDDRRAVAQPCHEAGGVEVAGPQRADRHLAIDPAEVEPRAVPAGGLHPRGRAPVGADHQRVGAGGQAHVGLEGQVDAGVARDEPPVDPDRRAVVDRLDAQRVVAVAHDRERRAIPGDAALEAVQAGLPAHACGVGRERHLHVAAVEAAAEPAEGRAALRAIAALDPHAVERAAPVGPAPSGGRVPWVHAH
jgi:hypothetical protein